MAEARGLLKTQGTSPIRDDEALVLGLRRGDPEAMREMVDDIAPQIYRLAYGITQDSMEAQDITQEVFVRVLRGIEDFQERASVRTWIYRIAVNLGLDRVRARKRRQETSPIEDYLPTFTPEGMHAEEIVDWSEAPLDYLLGREATLKIQEAIDGLPEDLRVVLVMKDVEGLHLKDICDVLELTLPAVKSRLHRARLVLRGVLSTYFEDELRRQTHEKTR